MQLIVLEALQYEDAFGSHPFKEIAEYVTSVSVLMLKKNFPVYCENNLGKQNGLENAKSTMSN